MSTLTWISEKDLKPEMKNKGDLLWEETHEKFLAAVRK